MSRARRLAVALLVLGLGLLVGGPRLAVSEEGDAAPLPPERVLAQMRWLAGTWEGALGGGTFRAYYSTPEGGKILSTSQLLKDGKPVFHEFEVFEADGDLVALRPYPGGRPVTGFSLQSADWRERKAVYENPKKDFPTRITYHRVAQDNLVITLSDPHGTSGKVQVFDLKHAR